MENNGKIKTVNLKSIKGMIDMKKYPNCLTQYDVLKNHIILKLKDGRKFAFNSNINVIRSELDRKQYMGTMESANKDDSIIINLIKQIK